MVASTSISANSAALTACEHSDRSYSNLEIQKILYLAHMRFLVEEGGPLVRQDFEAWRLGPVISELYHKLKSFGSSHVRNVFFVKRNMNLPNHRIIIETVDRFQDKKPFELVEMTHRAGGAWDRYFDPDRMHVVIPNAAIARDYLERPL